ncbi:MAG: hypothetical protein K2L82_13690 [Lachnospiraceae bacterium]|nr:hypothetical protein [Lachnospiraceae bacterium]
MVNRVNGNDYYDYSKLKMPDAADKTGNGEKFSLNYQRAPEEKEDKDKKEQTGDSKGVNSADISGKRTMMQSGVRLELSGKAPASSDVKRDNAAQNQSDGQGLFDSLRSLAVVFVQAIKDFFYKIWNDTAQEESDRDLSEPERLTEEYLALNQLESLRNPEDAARQQMRREAERDKEIQKYLRSGNLEQVMNLVTQNGQKTMAKNSTLLTYYDRTGKITPLNVSDQERILHGDRNVKKL